VNAFSGEPRFYSGDELKKHLRALIESASKIDIATAWVSESNVLKLLASQAATAPVRLVVGVGGYTTDPVVLKKLGTHPDITLKIYGGPEPPLFHPKLYVFQHQHFRRTLVGSMNLTNAGTTKNIESVLSIEDKNGTAGQEFERFWMSSEAVPFEKFDLRAYEAKRRALLAAVKEIGAAEVLEADVVASAESRVELDALKEGWKSFVQQLINSGHLEGHRRVLNVRNQFIGRDWSKELTKDELHVMFGTSDYYAFGRLSAAKQNQSQFQGSENSKVRKHMGALLEKASKLASFQRPIVKGLVQQLIDVPFCGPALATRLLVLARPDLFVVVNRKSFEGLHDLFGHIGSDKDFRAESYVDLLEKIYSQPWYRSPEPEDPVEKELWQARAALLDVLVYREKPGENDVRMEIGDELVHA
jgi:HKD family nuclease